MLNGSELTLELMQLLELMDNPTNYTKVLSACVVLQQKLDFFKEKVLQTFDSPNTPDQEAMRQAELELKTKLEEKTSELQEFRNRLNKIIQL